MAMDNPMQLIMYELWNGLTGPNLWLSGNRYAGTNTVIYKI